MKKFLKPLKLPAQADLAVLILRIGISALMLTHGYAKLTTALGGDYSFADPVGVGEELSLVFAIFAEFVCSILLILGLFTRLALIPLIVTMLVAVLIVHAPDTIDKKEMGLLYLFSYVALLLTGPGRYSVDNGLYK